MAICIACKFYSANKFSPYCDECLKEILKNGNAKEKARARYFQLKEQMNFDPLLKCVVQLKRREAMKKYRRKNREKWNAYQRECYKRKKLKQKTAEI